MSDSEANQDGLEDSLIPPELIEYIPEEKREEVISRIVLQEQYSGPLAHPRIVIGWERILSGSADRILTMTETPQRHRIEMENRGQKAAILRDRIAMFLGFVLGIALLLLAAYAITSNQPLASVGYVGFAAASLTGAFYIGRRMTNRELNEKREALQQPSRPPELRNAADQPDS